MSDLRRALSAAKRGPTEFGYQAFRAKRERRTGDRRIVDLTESEQLGISGYFDVSATDLAAHNQVIAKYNARDRTEIRSVQWFVPYFAHAYLGGIYTILRFADHFAREHGVENRFCIYDVGPERVGEVRERTVEAFPGLAAAEFSGQQANKDAEPLEHLAPCDASIGSLWTSIYPQAAFNRTRAKFYFLQDFEPEFYAAGSARALSEETYRLGIPGIVNTPGLADVYREYGNGAVSFVPAVDSELFHPRDRSGEPADQPVRIVFYGRPSTPRNAFGLGLAALREVKQRHGDRVEVLAVGEEWDPAQFGLDGVVKNIGRLPDLEAVAEFYRACDVGLVLMLTKHPSYQPFEYMASGVVTVSNDNPHTRWLLRNNENSLTAPPLASALADQISTAVEDPALRGRLTELALGETRGRSWSHEIDAVFEACEAGVTPSSS